MKRKLCSIMDAEHILQSMAAACMQPYSKFMQAKSSPQTEHWHEEALIFRNFDAELVTSERVDCSML